MVIKQAKKKKKEETMWAMVSDWQSLKYLLSGPLEKTFSQLPSPVRVREPLPGFISRIVFVFRAGGLGGGLVEALPDLSTQ